MQKRFSLFDSIKHVQRYLYSPPIVVQFRRALLPASADSAKGFVHAHGTPTYYACVLDAVHVFMTDIHYHHHIYTIYVGLAQARALQCALLSACA